jgi:ribosomal protein L37AE/L43A
MGIENRDPLVRLLQQRERGEEDVFFGRRDAQVIARARLRRKAVEEARAREAARMRCPECGEHLVEVMRRGVRTEACPSGHGVWVPPGGLETIPKRERNAWFDRYVHMRW